MPQMLVQRRAQGGYAASRVDPHDGDPCDCDWTVPTTAALLQHRVLEVPDQSRYGTATDPREEVTPDA